MRALRDKTILLSCLRPSDKNLGARVVRGAAWTFGGMGLRVILTLGSTAILARLLTPGDFGMIAMAALVTELAALFGNVGISAILIQKPRLHRRDLDTAFWIGIGVALVLTLLVNIVSFFAKDFFDEPRVVPILWAMSSMFILEGLATVQTALLARLLRFREDFLIQMTVLVVRIFTTVGFAAIGFNVWSLVFGSIVGRLCGTLLAWHVVPYLPRLRFDLSFMHNYWKYSGSILGSGILNYLFSNIDYLIVGRRFGAEALGYYQTAFSLPEEIRNRLSAPLQRVMFPAYALLQSDLPAFQQSFKRSFRLLMAIVMPLGVGLALVADPLVRVLYGDKWLAVIPLLQVLAIGGSLRAISSLTASIYYATNHAHTALMVNVFSLPIVIGGVFIGSLWGPLGVAWAMLLLSSTSIVSSVIALHLIRFNAKELLALSAPALIACGIMAIVISSMAPVINQYFMMPILVLFVQIMLGVIFYGIASFLINKKAVQDIKIIASKLIS